MVQTAVFDLADMNEAIALAEEIHESTEINDFDNFAFVNLAFFRLSHDGIDHIIGRFDGVLVRTCDLDDAIIIDINLGARGFHDLADHFTARPDHFANLVGWDLHGLNAWGMCRERIGRRQCLGHFAKDMHPPCFRLRKRLFHDFRGDPCNLDVHLQRGDPRFSACHFEIHVAKVIFITKDIGQNSVGAIFFQDQTHGHTRNRGFQRHACIHHRQGTTTDRSH